MNTSLDPTLKHENFDVQPEPLLDPESNEQESKPRDQKGLRYRLSR